MSVLKFIGKTLGTATLLTTGTASAVLKGLTDTVGFDIGSDILEAAKEASFDGVRSMWEDKELHFVDKLNELDGDVGDATRSQMARTAREAAEVARKNGDMDKYEMYMDQYETYRD